jgi:hypothetical protein
MLNVKTLTDTMSRMELPQLQQYASLHKNDPYIVTLALSIANQKKQMKAGQAGQAKMMPQPKVVDQQLAQMSAPPPQLMAQAMPEDQGIGTLPAQNMQNFAGGGIVAFEEGGDVPGYQSGVFTGTGGIPSGAIIMGNMYQDPVTGKMVPLPERDALPFGNVPINYAENKRLYLEKQKEALANRKTSAQNILNESPEDYAARKVAELEAQGGKQLSPDARNMAMSQFVKDKIGGQVKRGEAGYTTDSQLNAPKNIYTGTALPGATPPGKTPLGAESLPAVAGTRSSAAPTGPATAGLTALNTKPMTAEEAAKQAAALGDDKEVRKELQGYVDRQKKVGEDAVGSFKEGIAGLPEAYKKYEARLQKEEAEAVTDKDKAVGMSIFKAGLAMMSGTSQNAFENIGKGAMVGLEDQQAALKDFKKAQRERDKAFGDIEAARLADQRGDLKTKLELESRAADRTSNAEGKMVEGIQKLFDTNKTNARGIYQTGVEQANQNQRSIFEQGQATDRTLIQERGANARTQAQLSAPPAEARMAIMLGTGKTEAERLESGLRKVQDLQSDKTGATYAKLYADHVTESKKQMTEPMTPQEFATSMRSILSAMSPRPPAPLNQPAGQVRQ